MTTCITVGRVLYQNTSNHLLTYIWCMWCIFNACRRALGHVRTPPRPLIPPVSMYNNGCMHETYIYGAKPSALQAGARSTIIAEGSRDLRHKVAYVRWL